MLLREHLEESTKEQLLEQARNFEIKKCSGLRKAALIDRMVECFCTEEMLRNRLACLTKEQLDLFRKACEAPQDISGPQVVDGMQLYMYMLGYFEKVTDKFSVFEEVAEIFSRIDDEGFREDQRKKGWLMKCMHFFIEYYGIAPIEIIYELYKLKVKDSIDNMADLLRNMPTDIVESCIFSMNSLGLIDWPKEDPIYSDKGLLVHISLFEKDELGYLLNQQADKSFYIPSKNQIEEICRMGYEESAPAYKRIQNFLMRKMNIPYELAISWCYHVWMNSYMGESPIEIINKMTDADIEFQSEKQMEEFVGMLTEAHNSTRMKENRGHNPMELAAREFKRGMPTIVPGSSHAAAMLKDAAPQLMQMGFPVDLEGSADTITATMYPDGIEGQSVRVDKKIYPNDPCPCGSGKKYKKCCGRNRNR